MPTKLAVFATGVVLFAISCTKPNPIPTIGNQFPSFGDVPVAVKVDLSQQGIQIPADFTGISVEKGSLFSGGTYYNRNNLSFINLVKGLGHGLIRVGGSSVDQYRWLITSSHPDSMTLSTLDLGSFFAFAETTGWPVLYGLNLDIELVDVTGLEAQYLWEAYQSELAGFEFGNEPDLYSVNGRRPSSYNYEAFKYEWTVMHNEVDGRYPGAVYAGPGTASNNWVVAFARDRHSSLSWLTEHYYKFGTGADTVETIEKLLDGNTDALSRVAILKAAAAPYSLPYRITECNSSAGDKKGVSNTFASALWGLDFMFALAQQGVAGVNFQSGNAYSTPISFLSGAATPMPLYYGMLFFSKASAGKLLTVKSVPQSPINLTSYAVQQSDGTVQVTLINKDLSKEAFVTLAATGGSTQLQNASLIRLSAPSPNATTGILFGGDAVSPDGTWAASIKEKLFIAANATTVKIPACSAVLLTLGGSSVNK